MIRFLDLAAQYASIKQEIDDAIGKTLDECSFVSSGEVTSFENEFAEFVGAKECITCGNGTDALEIAIEALGLPQGSEIILPANTFVATAEAVVRTGHIPVFCDVDEKTYTCTGETINRCVTEKTRAVILVHLYGYVVDYKPILELCRERGIRVIEDCAQSHGGVRDGVMAGCIGDIAAFSFYPGKVLGAYGDGGAITTNNSSLANICRLVKDHGRIGKYDHKIIGRNSRLDGIQAAVLRVKLKHLPSWLERRREVASYYNQYLDNQYCKAPEYNIDVLHAYHLFVIRTNERDRLKEYLESAAVGVGIHYPYALQDLEAFSVYSQSTKATVARTLSDEVLSLPMGEHLDREACAKVVDIVNDFRL